MMTSQQGISGRSNYGGKGGGGTGGRRGGRQGRDGGQSEGEKRAKGVDIKREKEGEKREGLGKRWRREKRDGEAKRE